MSTQEQNKAVVRRFADLINSHDVDGAFALARPDFIDHAFPPGTPPGVESSRQFFKSQFVAFPDMRAKVLDMTAEGDKVAYRIEVEGTHQGPLMGISPTGKHVKWTVMSFARVADGKIAEQWSEMDTMGLMQQLGVIPPRAA
jgi:steroid delta-isomerase-like uncharacterized protein